MLNSLAYNLFMIQLSDLRQMMDSLKRMITGQGLEEENGETGEETEEKREPVMTPGNSLTEESRKGRRQQNEFRQKIGAPI